MTKKTLTTALIAPFILPAICFAGEIEVGEVKLKWIKAYWNGHYLLAQIPVTNRTDETWGFHGKLQFLDKDGFEIRFVPIWEAVRPREKRIARVNSRVSRRDYEKTATLKLNVKVKCLSVFRREESPLKIERILSLPPWPEL